VIKTHGMRNQKKALPYMVLKIDGEYEDFPTFYEINKRVIFDSIYGTFCGLKNADRYNLILHLFAVIDDTNFETEFDLKRDDIVILIRDLMPFYEKLEDYEMCIKVKNLYETLYMMNNLS
jgi:hypothetical protein